MALSTSVARRVACGNCRQWVLRSFIASIGDPSTPQHTPPKQPRRAFSTPSRRWNEARERLQAAEKDGHALNDINEEYSRTPGHKVRDETRAAADVESEHDRQLELEPEVESEPDPLKQKQTEEHLPWYLQVESPIEPQESNISARQRIPDLPISPPDLLEPLLKQVSVDLGMDDLTLLDLREMDPPPALGANLLMLIGTARSEKHLHVSADKLCRWLRSNYDLTLFADGLLGRQELKVKLRRRAKKARLMSAVGAKSTADTELDEGIRTGWVCVNVGRVEGGDLPKTDAELEAEKKIVGFGTRTRGSHVVVQLMTEEKRGEIDLEKLWTGILRRSKEAKEDLLKKEAEKAATDIYSSIADHVSSTPSETPQQSVAA